MTIGEALRERREELKLRQRDVAVGAGMSTQQISDLENGRQAPRWDTIMRLAGPLRLALLVREENLKPGAEAMGRYLWPSLAA